MGQTNDMNDGGADKPRGPVVRKKQSPRRLKPGVLKCTECKKLLAPETTACPHHPEAKLVFADPLIGKVIFQTYRLDKQIGRGGMADVYESVHITLPGTYAVKVLHEEKRSDDKQTKRFLREAEMQSQLKHDNCARVIEYGTCERTGAVFVAMEHIKGHTLKDELKEVGAFDPERALYITCQILDALTAAHDLHVLHRDLKPQNVMIAQVGGLKDRVRVLDFGGKRIEGHEDAPTQTPLTMPGTLFGTPAYMSPEQARGETLDERSDVYAAAVVLLHLLLGRSPFRGKDIGETLGNVLHMEPPRPSLLTQDLDLDPKLELVMLKALNKDPEKRFTSAEEFKQSLLACRSKGKTGKLYRDALKQRS